MALRWHTILLAILLYAGFSWSLLFAANEIDLIGGDFVYWLVVTSSTVGYGDLSPTTYAGKLIVALFIIPVGLGLFGLAVGRLAAFITHQWRKGVKGLGDINYKDHILVIGWNEEQTLQLIRLLLREMDYHAEKQPIALCVRAEIENPMPDQIGFVRVRNYTDEQDMDRAAITAARVIVINSRDDDVTMTSALYSASKNPQAHIITYFRDERLGALLKSHCPNVECMPSVTVEMIAKSAVDPGSSALHHQLLAVDRGMTQYSVIYQGTQPTSVRAAFINLKNHYQATLIGISNNGYESIQLNPDLSSIIEPGYTLYYIADERINRLDWSRIAHNIHENHVLEHTSNSEYV